MKLFGENTLAVTITQMAVIFQPATPLLIGALIAVQFGFKPMQMLVVAGAAFVGSGVVKFNLTQLLISVPVPETSSIP